MSYTIPPMNAIARQLLDLKRPQKPKILVVDDEPDNLDLLYRTFRRDFHVLRAESGIEALQILKDEGEVAVIISDQRMPEMKGTEFLRKTVPQFPNTIRIILTGFTDVEDLVEAINSGQVYKYITKPWDPIELKDVVIHATETYQLLKAQADTLKRAQSQTRILSEMIECIEQSTSVEERFKTIAALFGQSFLCKVCIVQSVLNGDVAESRGVYLADTSTTDETFRPFNLVNDPLTQQAIASQTMQLQPDITKADELSTHPYYVEADIRSHLVIPLLNKQAPFAVLSLQWAEAIANIELGLDDLALIHLLAGQLALSLALTT